MLMEMQNKYAESLSLENLRSLYTTTTTTTTNNNNNNNNNNDNKIIIF